MRCQTISISRSNWSFSAQTGLQKEMKIFFCLHLKDINVQLLLQFFLLYLQGQIYAKSEQSAILHAFSVLQLQSTRHRKKNNNCDQSVNNSFLSIQVSPILASTFFTQKRRQKNEMRCQTISISLFHWSFSAHFNWSLERDENYFSFAS